MNYKNKQKKIKKNLQIQNKHVSLHQENKQILNNLKFYIMATTVNTTERIENFLNS